MKKVLCFLVVIEVLLAIDTPLTVSANVLDGATEYGGHYYRVFHAELKWKDAKYFCESMGGHLATAETSDENEFLKRLAFSNKNFKSRFSFYIGGICDVKGFWYWITGEVITYSNWNAGNPNPHTSGGPWYMSIDATTLQWRSKDGNENNGYGHGLICEWESADSAHESNW